MIWATCFRCKDSPDWFDPAPLVARGMGYHDYVVIPPNGDAFWVPFKTFNQLYTKVAYENGSEYLTAATGAGVSATG